MFTSPRHTLLIPLLSGLLAYPISLPAQVAFPATDLARQDAAGYLRPLSKSGVVKYKVIASDFATNQAAATGKYSGHRITVIGTVSHLSKGHGENKILVVTIQDPSASLPAVKGEFRYGSIPDNSEVHISGDKSIATLITRDGNGNIVSQSPFLAIGQTVAIKGDFSEVSVGDIVLTACKLIPKERIPELRNELKSSQG